MVGGIGEDDLLLRSRWARHDRERLESLNYELENVDQLDDWDDSVMMPS